MRAYERRTGAWAAAALWVLGLATLSDAPAATEPGQELWQGADARIEQHRKADVVVRVVDAAGRPLPGAELHVEQTRHEFLFGCNIFLWNSPEHQGRHPMAPELQQAYRDRFAALLNYATLPFYWWAYEPVRGKPNHDYTMQAAEWCREHGIETKGHPLAWNHNDAEWWPKDPDALFQLQIERITDCVERFRGKIDRWDVVNEAAHYDRPNFIAQAPKMTGAWRHIGQYEFTRRCFVAARKANPDAVLLINDYRTDPAYEKVIEQLVDAQGKRLYDVIGIQSHMHGGTWSNERIWEVCNRFARFGVPLHFTETTILSGQRGWEGPKGAPWVSTPEGEQWQAREVVRFYTMLFSHPAVEAITWWDFADLYSWKQAPAGFLRRDMSPKPAYDELLRLVKGRWWTKATLHTDDAGTARLRGFRGQYRVEVLRDGRPVATGEFTLRKEGPNRWELTVKGE